MKRKIKLSAINAGWKRLAMDSVDLLTFRLKKIMGTWLWVIKNDKQELKLDYKQLAEVIIRYYHIFY